MALLGWEHHTLIQALLSRGPLKEREFHAVFAGVTGKNPVMHKRLFNDCLLKINKGLDFVQFELRACMDQYDGDIYYGIVNNVSDEQSKLGTKYSVPQIVFYKAIIEAIVLNGMNQGCITSIEALNIRLENQVPDGQAPQDSQSRIPAAFKSFTISQKEKTLAELIRDRWLSSTSDGKIGVGIRSFLDLRSWFLNNEVVPCHVCNEAAIKAEQCPKEGCPIRMHHYCTKKIFKHKPFCLADGRREDRQAWPAERKEIENEKETSSSGPSQAMVTGRGDLLACKFLSPKASNSSCVSALRLCDHRSALSPSPEGSVARERRWSGRSSRKRPADCRR